MKIIVIGFLVLVALLFTVQLVMSFSTARIEKYEFETIKKVDKFEIRKYSPARFSYVQLSTNSYKQSSGKGFRLLASYIFGNNKENAKIAMTSPVAMEMSDSVVMKFMVPSTYNTKPLPEPNDSRIQFISEPEKFVAAVRFGGWANDRKIQKYSQKLNAFLEKEGIEKKGSFSYLGYNPPYEIFFRRNEVIVEIDGSFVKNP